MERATIKEPAIAMSAYAISMHWWAGNRIFFANLTLGQGIHATFSYYDGEIQRERCTKVPVSTDKVKRILKNYTRFQGRRRRLPR